MNDYMLGKNPWQGRRKKALFVCTGGILRSATAAHYAAGEKGWNTRSCGIMDEAVPPIHINLLQWANVIYCAEPQHAQFIRQEFGEEYEEKLKILGIPDDFSYRSPDLLAILAEKLSSEESEP